jgi:uncharacterized protein (DUF1778 family)
MAKRKREEAAEHWAAKAGRNTLWTTCLPEENELLRIAAALVNKSKARFVMDAALEAARKIHDAHIKPQG